MEMLSIFLCLLVGYVSGTEDDHFDEYVFEEGSYEHLQNAGKSLPVALQKAVGKTLSAELNLVDAYQSCQGKFPVTVINNFNNMRILRKKVFLEEYNKAVEKGSDAARELAERYMVVLDFKIENYLKHSLRYCTFLDNSTAALKEYENLKQFDLYGLDSTKELKDSESVLKSDREKFENEEKGPVRSKAQQVIDRDVEEALVGLKGRLALIAEGLELGDASGNKIFPMSRVVNILKDTDTLVQGIFHNGPTSGSCRMEDTVKFFSEIPWDYEQMLIPTYFTEPFLMDYTIADCLRHYLPNTLRKKILQTDANEDRVIRSYAKSGSVPSDVLAYYNEAKKEEREALKEFQDKDPDVLDMYKRLRKGEAWEYIKHEDAYKAFFETPSSALTAYEALKKDESTFLDSFLNEQSQIIKANANVQTGEVRKTRVQAKEVEMADVLQRRLRAEDIETAKVVKAASGGTQGVFATTGDSEGAGHIDESPDNVTPANVAKSEATTG